MKKLISSFDTDYVDIPTRPDVDRVIVVPLRTVFFNVSAAPAANVTRLVHDLDEYPGFDMLYPVADRQR